MDIPQRKEQVDYVFGGCLKNSNLTDEDYIRLWYWLGFEWGGMISDDKRKIWAAFFLRLLTHLRFHPFMDKVEAIQKMDVSKQTYILRLSGTYLGSVAATYKKVRTNEVVNVRFDITDGGFLSWNPANDRCKIKMENMSFWIRQASAFI